MNSRNGASGASAAADGPRRVWVHIGFHKTGTTSIQHALAKLRSPDFLYPVAGRPFRQRIGVGHHLLPWALRRRHEILSYFPDPDRPPDEVFAGVWTALNSEMAAADRDVILSSEEFATVSDQQVADFAQALAGQRITPVVFIRNYADIVETLYRTHVVHHGENGDIAAFLGTTSARLNYPDVLRAWSAIADAGRVVVVNYDDPRVRRDSLVAFCAAIGIAAPPAGGARLNGTPPAFACELVRHMRAQGKSPNEVSNWLVELSRQGLSATATRYALLPDPMRHELDVTFARHVDEILDDPVLRRRLSGQLTRFKRTTIPIAISGPQQALQALHRELGRPRQFQARAMSD